MSAERVLDDVMRHAAEYQVEPEPPPPRPEGAGQPAEAKVTQLQLLKEKVDGAENAFKTASDTRATALAWGIILLLGSLVLIAVNNERLYGAVPGLPAMNVFGRVALLWTLPLIVAVALYFVLVRRHYAAAQAAVDKARQDYDAERLATEVGRKQYLQEKLFHLTNKVTFVFHGDQERLDKASERAALADKTLNEQPAQLSAAQGYINSLEELVTREEREQADENRWQLWAIAVMFLYVSIIVAAALLTHQKPGLLNAAAFGVPLSVILWGAAGSLAAILFRFYKEKEEGQIRFAREFRWLIARPIIGIIMGAVVYLALISGLVLISTSGGATADPGVSAEGAVTSPTVRMEAFWIIAFLAGFSDKFYLGVIDLLVARTISKKEKDSDTFVEEKNRTPEANPPADKNPQPQPANA